MARRNDAALAAALEAMANAVGAEGIVGTRSLATFQKENPPVFKGRYDPDGALAWLKEIERIFRFMDCTPAQKVRFGSHQLAEEADDWWLETLQRLENAEEELSWDVFKREFLRKYFPEDVRGKKEMEFLNLTQGNKSVAEYAAKFIELAKYHPHYNGVDAEFSKCIKFENGLRMNIKKAISYQKIRVFADLVDSCRIFEEDSNAGYKIVKERSYSQYRGKPYDVAGGKGKSKVGSSKAPSGGDAPPSVVCFNCGLPGHKKAECKASEKRCYRCGKEGHLSFDCDKKDVVCFNCGEVGHFSTRCTKPKKERFGGKVFALSGDRE